jgi:ABC-2 type transport system permease protein
MVPRTVEKLREGLYEIDLLKPHNPLSFATITAISVEDWPTPVVGLTIISYAASRLHFMFSFTNIASYLLLILFGILFLYSLAILVTSLAFLVVNAYSLINILDELINIGRYPLSIYNFIGIAIFTFILPVGLAAFYPASALLGRLSWQVMGELAIVTFGFLGLAILIWNQAIKKYASAGG